MDPTAAPAAPTEGVQPGGAPGADAGQGASGLYDLDSAPEHLRPYIEAELKKIEGNVTPKFQEHAEFRKQWEPYQELGLHDVPPEELQQLLRLREISNDDEAFRRWWDAIGKEMGYVDGDGLDEELGIEDEDEGPDLEEVIGRLLDERLGPIQERFSAQDEESAVAGELESIESELAALKEQHGEFDEDKVCQLALAYADDPDGIQKAFADYQQLVGGAQRNLVEDKLTNQPGVPVGGGSSPSPERPVDGFSGAKSAALERLRASR